MDYHFPKLRLTPGIELELKSPAAFTSPNPAVLGGNPPPGEPPERTIVLPDTGLFSVLPPGSSPLPTYRAKVTLRWDLEQFSVVGEGFLTDDPNRTKVVTDDTTGFPVDIFEPPVTFGFDVLAQARF